jgi:transcriptional regulator/ribosomal protein L32
MAYYNGKRDKAKTRKQRVILGWAKKLKAIDQLGNKCQNCGEDRPWLLDFHHVDESQKEYEISYLKHHSWEKLKVEIEKCILLCRNCHGDVHYKSFFIELEQEIKEKANEIEDNFVKPVDHMQILEMHKQGLTQKKISEVLGCGSSTVCEILKSNGIHTNFTKRIIDPLEVISLREEGFNNVQIGEKLGINRFTVPKVIKRWRDNNEKLS